MDKQIEEIIILVRAGTITKFRAIADLKKIFQETIEQAMPEKNKIGTDFDGYKAWYNQAIDEVKSNLLKAIGKEKING